MVALEYGGYVARELRAEDSAESFLPIFNSDPDFVDQNTLNMGNRAFSLQQVEEFLWQNSVAEHSHCLIIEEPNQKPAGVLAFLLPHPGTGQPWVGAFLLLESARKIGLFEDTMEALEDYLRATGWTSISVSPMESRKQDIQHWMARGYEAVRRTSDNNNRDVVVLSKRLEG